jgi:hypothetical protein
LQIAAPLDGGRAWFCPWSLNPAPFPLALVSPGDPREFPLSPFDALLPQLDPLWTLSVGPSPFTAALFPDTTGVLAANGQGLVRVNIPALPVLVGATMHGAFCTLDSAAPSGMRSLSPRIDVTFQ